jgi:hypothetical protein
MKHPLLGYLEYEAKVKPAIAELVAKVDSMTDEEIDAADTPLPWFKTALKMLKYENIRKAQGVEMLGVTMGHTPDSMGQAAMWTGGDIFIQASSKMAVELKTNTLVWFPETGGVWIESTFCRTVDHRLADLPITGVMTKSQYMVAYKESLAKRHGVVIKQEPESPIKGVRIYR